MQRPSLRYAHQKTVEEQVNLVSLHVRRSTPIRPNCLSLLIVITGREVHCRVDEAQHEAISSPIDYNFDRHILAVQGDFVSLRPVVGRTSKPQISADFGQARKAYAIESGVRQFK